MANKEFTKKWSSALIEDIVFKIKGGCIVPIIGAGVYYIEGENCGIQQFIVRELLRRNIPSKADDADIDNYVSGGFKGMTRLSRLFEQNNLELRTSLRALFYDESVMGRIKMNNQVLDFLQKGRFPLVLTTCYYKVLDSMITCDGNNYKVAAYRKEQRSVQDIQLSDADDTLTSPTIFHLFGMLDSTSKEYVVTENDFLSFLHCIQDTNHYPKRLKQYLENRFLLTLGCEIPDWTFRFLLYSLKEKNGELQKAKGAVNNFEGGAVTKAMNDDLDEFLSDIKYFSNNKVDDFLEDINSLLAPVQLPTIFLSMVHEEYESLGKKIKDALKRHFNVWFFADKNNPQYWKIIDDGISNCKYFMPVITSKSILKLLMGNITETMRPDEEPGIVTEWRKALAHKNNQNIQQLYCLPYLLDVDLNDFKNALKQKCQDLWPLFYSNEGNQSVSCPPDKLDEDPVILSLIKSNQQ